MAQKVGVIVIALIIGMAFEGWRSSGDRAVIELKLGRIETDVGKIIDCQYTRTDARHELALRDERIGSHSKRLDAIERAMAANHGGD